MTKSSQKTMKAVFWEGKPFHMVVREVKRPEIEKPTDAIIKITTSAICGSDLHNYHGLFGGPDVPFIMGHEAVGLVSEVGEEVTKYKVGDRVIVPGYVNENSSEFIYGEGTTAFGPNIGGLQAEFARMPMADDFLLAIPAGTDHELDFLLCSDIFNTAWTSITQTGFQAGDTVAVYGAGPVGLLAAYSALLRGAVRVYVVDHVESRLHRAESIGAIPIDLRKGDPSKQILELEPTGVKRSSDCIGFECVNPQLEKQEGYVINDMLKATAADGGMAITGVYISGPRNKGERKQGPQFEFIPFDVATWWAKGITIQGGADPTRLQEPALIDLIIAGRAKPSFVIDHIIHIDDAPRAYKLFSEHKVQKVAIDFTHRGSNHKRKHGEL